MDTKEVCKAVMNAIGSHVGDEKELYEELLSIAEGWKMRLEELEEED